MELSIDGKVVLIDDQDWPIVKDQKWHILKGGGYVIANILVDSTKGKRKYKTTYMHRLILGLANCRYPLVDHKNSNRLDNRRDNLRTATHSQNVINRPTKRGLCKYLGVRRMIDKRRKNSYNYIGALIRVNGKVKKLGAFKTEEEAALAYNEAAIRLHGEFARLNVL
jgi:hypothetical protein